MILLFTVASLLVSFLWQVRSQTKPKVTLTVEGPARLDEIVRMCCSAPDIRREFAQIELIVTPNTDSVIRDQDTTMDGQRQCYMIRIVARHHNSKVECTARYDFYTGARQTLYAENPVVLKVFKMDEPVITGPTDVGYGHAQWECKSTFVFGEREGGDLTLDWERVSGLGSHVLYTHRSVNKGQGQYAPLYVHEVKVDATMADTVSLAHSTTFGCYALHVPSKTQLNTYITVTRRTTTTSSSTTTTPPPVSDVGTSTASTTTTTTTTTTTYKSTTTTTSAPTTTTIQSFEQRPKVRLSREEDTTLTWTKVAIAYTVAVLLFLTIAIFTLRKKKEPPVPRPPSLARAPSGGVEVHADFVLQTTLSEEGDASSAYSDSSRGESSTADDESTSQFSTSQTEETTII